MRALLMHMVAQTCCSLPRMQHLILSMRTYNSVSNLLFNQAHGVRAQVPWRDDGVATMKILPALAMCAAWYCINPW